MATPETILDKLKSNKSYLGNYYYLFMLQYKTGSRITECLNICYTDISDIGMVLIKGLKGSSDKIVDVYECKDYLLQKKSICLNPFFGMNRFTAYRLLKNIGIQKLKKGRVRESVTHVFRDQHAKELRNLTSNKSIIAQHLGHKNVNNTDYYGKN